MIYQMVYNLPINTRIQVTLGQIRRAPANLDTYTARIIDKDYFQTVILIDGSRYLIENDNLVGVHSEDYDNST